MTQPGALEILIDLAAKQADARTRDLGTALKAETSEGKRLSMLTEYRTGYLATLAQAQRRGMSSAMLVNYTQFLSRLDAAIAQQSAVVETAKGHTEAARSKFHEAERKRKSLVTISDRRAAAARVVAARYEQKQHDEISNRLALHGVGVTQPMRVMSEQALREAMGATQPVPAAPVQGPKARKP